MNTFVDYYRALDEAAPRYDFTGQSWLLLGLTVLTVVGGLVTANLPVMVIASILAVATAANMQGADVWYSTSTSEEDRAILAWAR